MFHAITYPWSSCQFMRWEIANGVYLPRCQINASEEGVEAVLRAFQRHIVKTDDVAKRLQAAAQEQMCWALQISYELTSEISLERAQSDLQRSAAIFSQDNRGKPANKKVSLVVGAFGHPESRRKEFVERCQASLVHDIFIVPDEASVAILCKEV